MPRSLRARTTHFMAALVVVLGAACAQGGAGNQQNESNSTLLPGAGGAAASPTGSNATAMAPRDCVGGEDREGCLCDNNGETRACYVGDVRQAGVGVCVRGKQTCTAATTGELHSGTWGPCTGSGSATPVEVCNGLDDNCDGRVDEGNPSGGEACDTSKAGVCAKGVWSCQAGARQCVASVMPGPPQCNGFDNDCDGIIDAPTRSCTTAQGTTAVQLCTDSTWGECTDKNLWQATPCTQCINSACSSVISAAGSNAACQQPVAAYIKCIAAGTGILNCDQQYVTSCGEIRSVSDCAFHTCIPNNGGSNVCVWGSLPLSANLSSGSGNLAAYAPTSASSRSSSSRSL